MSESHLSKKMKLKAGAIAAVINAPENSIGSRFSSRAKQN